MSHNSIWLDDKKALNDMKNVKMPRVLFIKIKANVYNRDYMKFVNLVTNNLITNLKKFDKFAYF